MRTLLIDNYDSYTYNLFHLLGQVNGEEPDVLTNDAGELPDLDRYDNVVISPGPGHPARPRDFGISLDVLRKTELPVLGVCLGHQGLAVSEGGEVIPAPRARHGHVTRVVHNGDPLFGGIPVEFGAVRYHSLCVAEPLPHELEAIARSEDGVVQALRHRRLPRWGVQFHPESIETEHGLRLMANFRDLSRSSGSAPRGRGSASETSGPVREEPAAPVQTQRYRLHVRELAGAVDTEAAFQELYADSAHAFWLDSARVEEGLSRFSFLGDGSGPLAETVRYRTGEGLVVVDAARPSVHRESVFDYLKRELTRREIEAPPLPFDFTGGYVGYFGYELKADCGSPNAHTARTPDAVWLFADRFLAVDHAARRTYLLALSEGPDTGAATRWLERTAARLAALGPLDEPPAVASGPVEPRLAHGREAYVRAVQASQDHLHAGESYEVCLTNSADFPAYDSGWETYRRLRRLNPAPYAAFLHLGDLDVACSSPERFLTISPGGTAETKPIKGTAPRGATPAEDEAARRELVSSAKTRAENLMIVDLLRNDLGRVCEVGSVEVPVLMAAESYATVHQLVSTIRGRLKPGADAVDCVRACFPGGSMTGAPKLRTLEIIESLERRARGIYSGSLGYLSCNGAADLNIVIRTMVRTGDRWELGAGGAIVLDSDPVDEYEEMLLKADAPARALRAHPLSAAAAAAPAESNGSDLA
ncbi:Para-aminobenzoate synthase [Streptomyces albus]|uniref:aminodeoxychorismate synthase n=1 Tax=Streptomyces albus (strain ATCC 21838 / DSM 41398 / FERM P-419 / JCM 4703 / NBRC 107858) TaxID=1081613 RepID=A0A0B5EPS5_STRA4|nr:Para-aminobenzoate synthase [Streptomyces albus]AOU75585.1 Para-aminobenzoate synthase [Streptomyces albus]AYN31390.1 aminodeoxychorismate synthase, component I [Streptomyces albus]